MLITHLLSSTKNTGHPACRSKEYFWNSKSNSRRHSYFYWRYRSHFYSKFFYLAKTPLTFLLWVSLFDNYPLFNKFISIDIFLCIRRKSNTTLLCWCFWSIFLFQHKIYFLAFLTFIHHRNFQKHRTLIFRDCLMNLFCGRSETVIFSGLLNWAFGAALEAGVKPNIDP